jgi:hypothetical protein
MAIINTKESKCLYACGVKEHLHSVGENVN